MAAGLPTEGTTAGMRVGDHIRTDLPTVLPDTTMSEARTKLREAGMESAVVVNTQQVVLGLLGDSELSKSDRQRVREVMRPGPGTFRPHVPIGSMAHHMMRHDLPMAVVTTSDGRLVGVLHQEDAVRVAHSAPEDGTDVNT